MLHSASKRAFCSLVTPRILLLESKENHRGRSHLLCLQVLHKYYRRTDTSCYTKTLQLPGKLPRREIHGARTSAGGTPPAPHGAPPQTTPLRSPLPRDGPDGRPRGHPPPASRSVRGRTFPRGGGRSGEAAPQPRRPSSVAGGERSGSLSRAEGARSPSPAGSHRTAAHPGPFPCQPPPPPPKPPDGGAFPCPPQRPTAAGGRLRPGRPTAAGPAETSRPYLDDAAPPRGGLGRLQQAGVGVGCRRRPQAAAGEALGGADGRDAAAPLPPPARGRHRGVQRSRLGLLLGTVSGVGRGAARRRAAGSLCHRPGERRQLLRGAERAWGTRAGGRTNGRRPAALPSRHGGGSANFPRRSHPPSSAAEGARAELRSPRGDGGTGRVARLRAAGTAQSGGAGRRGRAPGGAAAGSAVRAARAGSAAAAPLCCDRSRACFDRRR